MKKIFIFIKYHCFFLAAILYYLYYLKLIDKRTLTETIRRKKEKKIRRKYGRFVTKVDGEITGDDYEKNIWVCWLQGEESAPQIVKKCIKSIKKQTYGWNVNIITASNFKQYVNLPAHILEKWGRGIITNTHFSDILRCKLLIEHGGLWIDATCLMTSELPDFVYKNNFFTFRNEMRNETTTKLSSWFIFSKKDNKILEQVFFLESKYWEKSNILDEYFLFHLFFDIVIEKNNEVWDSCLPYYDVNPHIMSKFLMCNFNIDFFNEIKKQSFIHKLTYKIKINSKNKTLYDYLIANEDEQYDT